MMPRMMTTIIVFRCTRSHHHASGDACDMRISAGVAELVTTEKLIERATATVARQRAVVAAEVEHQEHQ